MSLSLNNDTINAVNFNGAPISTVNFNGSTVWTETPIILRIGTKHANDSAGIILANPYGGASSDALYTLTANNPDMSFSFCGFTVATDVPSANGTYNVLACFDGLQEANNGYIENLQATATELNFYLTLPFKAQLKIVNAFQFFGGSDTLNATLKHPTTFAVSTAGSASATSYNSAGSAVSFSSGFASVTPSMNSSNIQKIKFKLTYPSTDKKRAFGEFRLRIDVKPSDYYAWKSNYSSAIGSNINNIP